VHRDPDRPIRGAELDGSQLFTVHIARTEGKWAGQCQQVDVFALMDDPAEVVNAMGALIREHLQLPADMPVALELVLSPRPCAKAA
jgi:hypothetical protein